MRGSCATCAGKPEATKDASMNDLHVHTCICTHKRIMRDRGHTGGTLNCDGFGDVFA